MRSCTAGNGSDSTAAVLAWLQASKSIIVKNVYLIGRPEDPLALWLTDWETPLSWPCWTNQKVNTGGFPNAFDPAVIKRGSVTSGIGFDVQTMTLTWTPVNKVYTTSIATASPYQLAALGYYDNWPVRAWTVFMPKPGDANTFGCAELFGGRVADTKVNRGTIVWSINSFLDVVNQYVPTNVIELLNTGAAYAGATIPSGFSHIPQFVVGPGSSTNVIIGIQTYPDPGTTLGVNAARGGYLVFNQTANSTLGGVWSAILQNDTTTTGEQFQGNPSGMFVDQFVLGNPLPWPPTPGLDTFFVSGAAPINKDDGDYFGFPYVPNPASAA